MLTSSTMPLRPHTVWFHMFDFNHLVIGWGDAVKHLQPLQSSLASLGFVGKHAYQEETNIHVTNFKRSPMELDVMLIYKSA